ncbi:MAG: cytochrome c oxidase subunit 3 [Bacteroidota bacterium]
MQKEIDYKNIYYPPGGLLIWILISLELLTFGIALIALVFMSKENPDLYHQSRLMLNTTYGAINTVFLLTSGFFMATTVHLFKKGNFTKASFLLKLTMLGGFLFLALKTLEYYHKIEAGLVLDYNTFFSFYWLLTGFHVIHVIVGLVILLYFNFTLEKQKTEDLEAGAAFWHMCDLIWLLLFPVIYLIL